ncbi:MAG: LLM class flavin-dependent oxidoreductase [Stellaceae bacterium]
MAGAFGVSLEGKETPETLRAIVDVAEAAGASTLWIACHLFQREPIAMAAAALAGSRRVGAALMAMSPYSVHPVYAAMAAATLDEYFPGRVQLCFGVGAPRDLEAAGIAAPQPLSTLRESIELARALLGGETVSVKGQRFQVQGRRLATGARPIPILLAASGPQMLELAGAAADGVLISAATSPEFIRWTLELVRRGEAASGRTIRKIGLVYAAVAEEERRAHDGLRRTLAFILRGAHHARNLALAGTVLDQAALADAFAREDWPRVDALITDDVLRRHAASGTPAQLRAAFARYHGVGLDEIVIAGVAGGEALRGILAAAAIGH